MFLLLRGSRWAAQQLGGRTAGDYAAPGLWEGALVLPQQVRYWTGEEFAYAPKLAAVDVPQEAVSAQLTMTLTFDGVINHSPAQWEQVYTIEGVRDGSCFLFQLTYQGEPDGTTLEELAEQSWMRSTPSHWTEAVQQNQIPYTLEFFDADGQVLLTQTNS